MTRIRERHRSRRSGTASVELTCGSVFIMVLLMVAIDITIMMLGYQLNDRACRAATRAAAQQSSASKAFAAVGAALSVHKGDGFVVTSPKLSTQPNALVYNDFNGNPYGGNPTVSVCTEVTVKVPVPVVFFDQSFGKSASGVANAWTFRRKYTYPILDVNLVLP